MGLLRLRVHQNIAARSPPFRVKENGLTSHALWLEFSVDTVDRKLHGNSLLGYEDKFYNSIRQLQIRRIKIIDSITKNYSLNFTRY